MSVLAILASSAVGLLAIAVAWAIGQHYSHLPGAMHPWLARLVIVIMYCGGSVIVAAGLGTLVAGWIARLTALIGAQYAGLINTGIVIFAWVMLVGLAVVLIWAPTFDVANTAAATPLLLSLVPGGFIGSVYVATTIPGQAVAAQIAHWLAG